ncbi:MULTISPECIES: TolC family protein [Noviherbaspirillum]|jgi:cobalt-zinc-cadmium efflux system outer membrane protein|uniref:TolC family protein n=1 Tax=Noviherbaspirillum TaxID=1344552 RepID=UPI00124E8CC6|nr:MULTISPECIES: TolC family protein [Noviherbaspirillum]
MYRYLLPLSLAVFSLPGSAQTVTTGLGSAHLAAQANAGRAVEPALPLTLQAAIALAMNSSPDLSAAQYELQAVEATLLQANVLPNPSLEVGIEDRRRETRESTLTVSQPIELGGKRSARMRAAESSLSAASSELNAKKAEIRAAVITAFFDVLAAQERVRLAEEAGELAQRATNVANKRVAAGKVSPVEETKARVAESSVRLELAQARSELSSSRKRLSATWGNLIPRFEKAEGQLDVLPELPSTDMLTRRLATSPALSRARYEVDHRQALAQVERSRRIPDMAVTLGVKRSEELGRNQAVVGVSIPLPLFDSNRGNVLESLRRVDKARDELSATEIRLDGEVAQAYEKLSVSRQEAESLQKEVIPGAQSAYDAASKGFEFGKFGFLDVLDAQRTLLQAKSQYLRALSEAHRAAADIDRILGEATPATKQ